jgi:hypothetical protein
MSDDESGAPAAAAPKAKSGVEDVYDVRILIPPNQQPTILFNF